MGLGVVNVVPWMANIVDVVSNSGMINDALIVIALAYLIDGTSTIMHLVFTTTILENRHTRASLMTCNRLLQDPLSMS